MIKKLGIGCGGLVALLVILVVATSGARPASTGSTPAPGQTQTPAPTGQVAAPVTAAPQATAAPTPTPTPRPTPLVLSGIGQFATNLISVSTTSNATFTHNGARNFIVYQVQGTKRVLLVNTVGVYAGIRPLWAEQQSLDPFQLSIEADGAWSITIAPVECCATDAAFVGRGDKVSTIFYVPATRTAAWEFSHDGARNYIVYLHCKSGSQLIQNRVGAFQGSTLLTFGEEWCLWDVRGDGNWSMRPRP